METFLAFHTGKTEVLLITANQVYVQHKLRDQQFKVCCNNITLERAGEWKRLGVTTAENLKLNEHVSQLLKNCYSY